MKFKSAFLLAELFLFSAANAVSDVQVVEAKKENLKLCPELTVAGELSLSAHPISTSDLSKDSLPRFVRCDSGSWGIALSTSKMLHLLDPTCTAVILSLPIADVGWIGDPFPEGEDCLVVHLLEGKRVISRVDMTSGQILWSSELDFTSRYFQRIGHSLPLEKYMGGIKSQDIGFYEYSVPYSVSFFDSSNQILICGLTARGGKSFLEELLSFSAKDTIDWGNRIVFLDAASGKILQDEKYDLQRETNNSLQCFISLERNEFRILDPNEGKLLLTGKFNPDDVLAKKGISPPVDIRKADRDIIMNSDVHPLQTDSGLLLVSHGRKGSAVSSTKLEASWLQYDLEGKRLGPITPPPLSSLSFQVRNHGDNGWPVVLLGMKNKYMGPGVDSLVIVYKDGSISEAPWPKIKANFFTYVFYNGQNLYVQAPKGWFRCVIGEENAVPVTWEEVQKAGPSDLSWYFFDAARATQSLPKVPSPILKKYVDFSIGSHTYGLTENNNSNQIRSLRLWGKDPQKDLGDILLIPALLKDNSAMLVGVSLPENKVVFYLPVLHIRGLPQEDYSDGVSFIFGVRYLDDRRALLMVGETLNSYKVYSLTRPAMPLDAPAN